MASDKKIETLIKSFMNDPKIMDPERIYNEFSLQHELGIYLRNNLEKDGFKVQFERNVEDFGGNKDEFVKKEIDIVVFKGTLSNHSKAYAIELKYPVNKAASKRMYQFVKDIQFMEEVNVKSRKDSPKNLAFDRTYCLTLVPKDANGDVFRIKTERKSKHEKIYKCFRINLENTDSPNQAEGTIGPGEIKNLGEDGPENFDIQGEYRIEWKVNRFCYYYLYEMLKED